MFLVVFFAIQFNQSRFFYLSCLILTGYFALPYRQEVIDIAVISQHQITLFGSLSLLYLAFVKDRGIFSIHFFSRMLGFACCAGATWLWEEVSHLIITVEQLKPYVVQLKLTLLYGPYIAIALVLLWRSLKVNQSVVSALTVSFVLWWAYQHNLWLLTLDITVALLLGYFFIAMVFDCYFLAYRDELTCLPSRRALNQAALSLGRKYTVAMMDIDHFKKFNDTYGHDIGDQVLKLVASKLAKVKSGGKVFRYGGEEFTVIFPRKSIEQTKNELEILRQSIADYKMVIRHPQRKSKQDRKAKKNNDMKSVSVTISIGVATRTSKQSFEQVIKSADQALYRAKKAGRNQVCV